MNKTVFLLSLCLSSGVALADRPWVSGSDTPATHSEMPASDESARNEANPAFVPAPAVPVPTATVQTGTAVEIQPGETLPVKLLDFPHRGMSMEKVQNELGRPLDISPSVGQPPITSWRYQDRKVFFEYDKVIHTVAIQ